MEIVDGIDTVFGAIGGLRFAVVGDFCLDFYQVVDMAASETSVETGKETLPVREVRYSLGGAANVVNNLCALGARSVLCIGIVGKDPNGRILTDLLRNAGADPGGLLVQESEWLTQTYTKVVVDGVEQPRIDWGNYNRLSRRSAEELLELVRTALDAVDVLVVNEQVVSGIHTKDFRLALAALIAHASDERRRVVLVDSRSYSDELAGGIRKLNTHEAARICGRQTQPGAEIGEEESAEIAETLYRRWGAPLLLTRGEQGCLVRDAQGADWIPGLMILGATDPVGAGDALLAGTAAALGAGLPLGQAARFGNLVAGVTVQKLFETGTASPEEVRSFARVASYRMRPELARSPAAARRHGATRIEIVTALPDGGSRRPFTHAIFDNDGTLSTLREGWEEVMEESMLDAILGDARVRVDDALKARIRSRILEYIDRTTGIQTIAQMEGLVELVREHGLVPKEQILDAPGYKRGYNERLMLTVRDRVARLQDGTLESSDFTIKGAVGFAASLKERGIELFLASGTDHEDVRREAELLGYAALFGDSIYGSVGDAHNDPKRRVVETILGRIGGRGDARIITFGDGPVEIQETKRRDGYAVGVASNELRRFGVDLHKRARLIQAGADLVVGDFSEGGELLRLLFGE